MDKCRNDVVGVFPNAVELLGLASSRLPQLMGT
jgi:hypothetical protein